MFHRTYIRFCAVAASCALLFGSFAVAQDSSNPRPRKYKTPPPAARIEITVLRASNGKPIENASVIFHPIEGDKDKGALEVKTNEDGKTVIDVVPIGDTVRMQIVAKGFQTYGEDYKIDKDQIAKEIRMNRPGQQYSIYKDNKSSSDNGSPKDQNAPNGSAPNSNPNGSANQPSTPDSSK